MKKSSLILLTLCFSFFLSLTSLSPANAEFDKGKIKSMEKFREAEKKAREGLLNDYKISENGAKPSTKEKLKIDESNKPLSIFEKLDQMFENFQARYNVYLNEKIALQPFLLPEEVLVHQDGEKFLYDFKTMQKIKVMKKFDDLLKLIQKLSVASPETRTLEQILNEIATLKKQVKFHPDLAGLKIVKGFSGENTFSFQLLKNPELYLCLDGEASSDNFTWKKLAFKKVEENEAWKNGSSFKITNGKAYDKWMSIESLAFPGWFVSLEPEKFRALPSDFKNLEDLKRFVDRQKKSSLVLIEYKEMRLHRLLTTFRFTTFAPTNEFAKIMAERDMQENPELATEILNDLGTKLLAMSEARMKLSQINKLREDRLAAWEKQKNDGKKAKEEKQKKKASELRKKLDEAIKKLKAAGDPFKGKPGKGDPKQNVTNDAKTLGVNVSEKGDRLTLLDVLAKAVNFGILSSNFDFGNLPIDAVELKDYELKIDSETSKKLTVSGKAYTFGQEIGRISLDVDEKGFFLASQVPVFHYGLATVTSFDKKNEGPEFHIEINNATQTISLKGALWVLSESTGRGPAISQKGYKTDVNFTGEGMEARFDIPVGILTLQANIEADFSKNHERCSFEAFAHASLVDGFQEAVFPDLKKNLPGPLKGYVDKLLYPISLTLGAEWKKNTTPTLGLKFVYVLSGKEGRFEGEVAANKELLAAVAEFVTEKLKNEIGKLFAEIGEFGAMVWEQFSSNPMVCVDFVVGLGNVVGEGATLIAQQTQVYFQKGLEEAKMVISVVTDKMAGTIEKAAEVLEETGKMIVGEIIKFGYGVCETLNPANWTR